MDSGTNNFLRTLWEKKMILILVPLIGAVTSYFFSFLIPKNYRASSTFMKASDANESQSVTQLNNFVALMSSAGDNSVSYYIDILKSRKFVSECFNRIGLEMTQGEIDEFREKRLRVEARQSGAMVVFVEDKDPKLAAKIANIFITQLAEEESEFDSTGSRKMKLFLEEQVSITQSNLKEAERAFTEMQQTREIVLPESISLLVDQIGDMEALKASNNVKITAEKAYAVTALELYNAEIENYESSNSIGANPLLQELESQLLKIETDLVLLKEKYTEKHPEIINLEQKKSAIIEQMKQLESEVSRGRTVTVNPTRRRMWEEYVSSLVRMASLNAQTEVLNKTLDGLQNQLSDLAPQSMAYLQMQREVKVAEQVYLYTVNEYEMARVLDSKKRDYIRVIDPAVEPLTPFRPIPVINALIAGVLCFFFVMGWISIERYLRDSPHNNLSM
jgi:uncharacterized protein involved in exopolysaccharide biosynthesis